MSGTATRRHGFPGLTFADVDGLVRISANRNTQEK